MCKLGKYQEANEAAKRATIVDGKWAKAWWRRGVVAELMKDPIHAANFYNCAVDLEPQTKAYKQALQRSQKMMGIKKGERGPGGLPVLEDTTKKPPLGAIPSRRGPL
jgi:tetratricopeptide (TPR) repeat protein